MILAAYKDRKETNLQSKCKLADITIHLCNYCDVKFYSKKFLNLHVKKEHKKYHCNDCDNEYDSARRLEYHTKSHKPYRETEELKCGFENCNYTSRFKYALTYHLLRHSGEKGQICNICEKSFYQKEQLNEHLRIHTGRQCSYLIHTW